MNLGIWGQIKGKHKNHVERGVMGTENRNDTLHFTLVNSYKIHIFWRAAGEKNGDFTLVNEFFCLDFYDFGCRNAILINGACFQTPKNFPGATAPGTPLRAKGFKKSTKNFRPRPLLKNFIAHRRKSAEACGRKTDVTRTRQSIVTALRKRLVV